MELQDAIYAKFLEDEKLLIVTENARVRIINPFEKNASENELAYDLPHRHKFMSD